MTQHHRVVPGGHGSTGRQVAPSASTSLSRMAPQPRAALFGWRLSPGTFLSCVVALRDERLGDPPPFLLCLLLREDSSKKQANFLGPIFILCLLVRVYAVNVLSAWTLVLSAWTECSIVPPVSQDEFLGGLTALELVSLWGSFPAVSKSALVEEWRFNDMERRLPYVKHKIQVIK